MTEYSQLSYFETSPESIRLAAMLYVRYSPTNFKLNRGIALAE